MTTTISNIKPQRNVMPRVTEQSLHTLITQYLYQTEYFFCTVLLYIEQKYCALCLTFMSSGVSLL